jgi:multidrug efflux pump subunit AcrA (membrane-fusion protein)
MTTGNVIETFTIPNVLYVPLEAVSSDGGVPFVYRQAGGGGRVTKQEVASGAMNDDEVVVQRGLEEGDRVLLTPPPGHERLTLVRLPPAPPTEVAPVAGGDTARRTLVAPPSRDSSR